MGEEEGKQELQSEKNSTASSNEDSDSGGSESAELFENKLKKVDGPPLKKLKVLAASLPEPKAKAKGKEVGITGIGIVKSKTICFKCPYEIEIDTMWLSYRTKVSNTLKDEKRCHVL